MAKAKEQKEPKEPEAQPILYNSKAAQNVVLNLDKNGKTFRIIHKLNPLSFERYFQFQENEQSTITRLKKISTAMAEPIYRLWSELCEGVEGYIFHDKADWKIRVHRNDTMAAISGLLFLQILDDSETEAEEDDQELYDDEKPSKVVFRAMYSGALVTLTHHFREMSKAEADEFLAISTNQPNDAQLASAVKQSEVEKLYNLGKRMLVNADGYADASDVPPWHLAQTVKTHCIRENERSGKFLTPSHLMPGV
jgi:hypothetical protein